MYDGQSLLHIFRKIGDLHSTQDRDLLPEKNHQLTDGRRLGIFRFVFLPNLGIGPR
jgi:hypothetical protein